jgi:hypothetical protein
MSLYPERVARCQHIKINGTQCGSPALRREIYCFFHMRWALKSMEIDESRQRERWNATLALPEDADSIQMGLGEVIRLMLTRRVDHRTAALTLYALQTASANVKHTSFEPEPTTVVIDRECVGQRPIGATAWSPFEEREYEELGADGRARDPWILKQEREAREEHEQLDRWLTRLEATPANERLLPNESQRDRGIRVRKQRAQAAEAAQLKLDSECPL